MKIKILQIILWFKNLFSKNGRKDNYFTAALKNIKKVVKSKFQLKKQTVDYVKKVQRGPKKSNFELYLLLKRKGVEKDKHGTVIGQSYADQLITAGVKVDWKRMKFLN